jgi:hypothetical protein
MFPVATALAADSVAGAPYVATMGLPGEPCLILSASAQSMGPHLHQLCSATSRDGLSWVDDNHLIAHHASVSTLALTASGALRMWFVQSATGPEEFACAESGDGGTTWLPLSCSVTGVATGQRLVDPSVVRLADNRWRLYAFQRASRPDLAGDHTIIVAESLDGLNFRVLGSAFSSAGLVDPDVYWDGTQWVMHVMSVTEHAMIRATSTDGLTFTRVGTTGVDAGTTAPVRMDDGRWRMYSMEEGNSSFASYVSTNGARWTREGTRLRTTGGHQLLDPFVVRLADGTWKMIYVATPQEQTGKPPSGAGGR